MIGAVTTDLRPLTAGVATGPVITLVQPLSFWGGTSRDGVIIDPHHPQVGTSLAGAIVYMPPSRGSSSSSSVLAEQLRRGSGPVGIILKRRDPIVLLANIVADELYGLGIPIVEAASNFTAPPDGTVLALASTEHTADVRRI